MLGLFFDYEDFAWWVSCMRPAILEDPQADQDQKRRVTLAIGEGEKVYGKVPA